MTPSVGKRARWDFFVSYTQADQAWAEWIAWTLEEEGYRVLVQAWDFPGGSNWIQGMHVGTREAARTIAVLSPDYLESVFGGAEWQAAWAQDPRGTDHKLLTVRVRECDRPGLLAGVVSVDLFGIAETVARDRLRKMVTEAITGRAKPVVAPGFPGGERALSHEPQFPGGPQPRSVTSARQDGTREERSTSPPGSDAGVRRAQDRALEVAEDAAGKAGGKVAYLSDFRRSGGNATTDAPDMEHFHNLITELSESAELVAECYSAHNEDYLWIRLDLGKQLTMIEVLLEQMTQWLSCSGMMDDILTFDLTRDLSLYTGTADEFVRVVRGLEPRRSSSEQQTMLGDFQEATCSLGDLLWRIHREFVAVWRVSGPSGLR